MHQLGGDRKSVEGEHLDVAQDIAPAKVRKYAPERPGIETVEEKYMIRLDARCRWKSASGGGSLVFGQVLINLSIAPSLASTVNAVNIKLGGFHGPEL